MNERLRKCVELLEQKLGKVAARAKLTQAIKRSERALLSWMQFGPPTANDVVVLALACECDEEEAWDLAKESFPMGAARSA